MQCPECGGKIRLPSLEQVESARQEMVEADLFQLRLAESLQRLQPQQRGAQLFSSPQGSNAGDPSWLPSEDSSNSQVAMQLDQALRLLSDSPQQVQQQAEMEKKISRQERLLAAATVNFKRPKPPESQEMDMTPMVDVTFLLLIFFMVTASFVVQKSIQRPAERSDEPSLASVTETEDPDAIYVQVDEFNAYNVLIEGVDTPVGSKQDLIVLLANAVGKPDSSNPSRPTKLIVDAHENCIHAAVVAALDAGREAQIENFEVRTVEQFD